MTHSTVALQLFDVLCPGVCIMTEDVMNNASFMSCEVSSGTNFVHCTPQKIVYDEQTARETECIEERARRY